MLTLWKRQLQQSIGNAIGEKSSHDLYFLTFEFWVEQRRVLTSSVGYVKREIGSITSEIKYKKCGDKITNHSSWNIKMFNEFCKKIKYL